MKTLLSLMMGIALVVVANGAAQRLIQQAPNGVITLNARDAEVHGKTIRYEPQPHKNTIGYWTKAEDWVSWDFAVSKPGVFNVTLTQACGKGSGGSEYTVSLGELVIRDIVPDTGAFTNWVERTIGTFNVSTAGTYTISVKPVKKPGLAVMDLRAIVLAPKPSAP
jgi:arylsulfatase A